MRPSSSSGRVGNEFIASMIVLPLQVGRTFAISRCFPNGIARMIVSASTASCSDLATTVGPISRACDSNSSGDRRLATVTCIFCERRPRREPFRSFRILQLHSSRCSPILVSNVRLVKRHPRPGGAGMPALEPRRLDLRPASIDGKIRPGDIGAFIGSEKHDRGRDFLGLAPTTHRNLRGELSDSLLSLFSGKTRRRC